MLSYQDNLSYTEEVCINLFQLPFPKFIVNLNRLSLNEFSMIASHVSLLEKVPDTYFNAFFLKCPISIQTKLLEVDCMLTRFLTAKPNIHRKNLYDLVEDPVKVFLFSNYEPILKIDPHYLQNALEKMSVQEFEKWQNYNLPYFTEYRQKIRENLLKNSNSFINELQQNYHISKEDAEFFYTMILHNKRDPLVIQKIKDENDFFLYLKFGMLLESNREKKEGNVIVLKEGSTYKKKFLNYLNHKHISLILEKLKKENSTTPPEEILVTAIQLYGIFGFDNTMKILNNKFTYMTESALYRAAELKFIEERRKYRLLHQEEFLSYDMINKGLQALQKKDISFFKGVCSFKDNTYIYFFIESLSEKIKNLDEKTQAKVFYKIMADEIEKREKNKKEEAILSYEEKYYTKSKAERGPITCKELYDLFSLVNNSTFKLDEAGRCVPDKELNSFLLGNFKTGNDCLLRMILNAAADGLNDILQDIINQFTVIQNVVQKSKGNLSLHSLLDVVDICRASFYHLEPNQTDLSLNTLSKIVRSHKHCNEPKEFIMRKALEFHVNQKKKVYASIPSVSGKTEEGVSYSVIPYDEESLLTIGIDTGSCLKVGGKGEDFLNYLLTSDHALFVRIEDTNGQIYICPFIRSGNGIFGNGLDPALPKERIPSLIKALSECTCKMMKECNPTEPIEFATITDLHMEADPYLKSLKTMPITEYIPVDAVFYSDYHKPDKTTYVIASLYEDVVWEKYTSSETYFQPRRTPFEWCIEQEKDTTEIFSILNDILYTYIDCRKISTEEKNRCKREFSLLESSNYIYAVGNKDWFLAIDIENRIKGCILPYDYRAQSEYLKKYRELACKREEEERKIHGM